MDDLISRQAAMAYPISWEHYDKEHGDRHFICGVESYREYIESLPSAQQWIPCSERLPKPWTSVLVTYIYNGKRFVEESQYTGQDDERGNPLFSSYADEYKVSNAYFQKIAWMPLPEPYKGDDNG